MVRLNKAFSKAYADFKKRFGVYVSLSFISIFTLTLIMMFHSYFLKKIIISGNEIYSQIVTSNTLISLDLVAPQLISIFLSFLIWVITIFIILTVSFTIIITSLKSKLSFHKHFFLYSLITSLILGLMISFILGAFNLEVILFYTLLIYSIIYLIIFFIKDFKHIILHLKQIWSKILIYELIYFLVVIFLLIVKIGFIKASSFEILRSIMSFVDLTILIFFLHLLIHTITKIKHKKTSFSKLFVYSLKNKLCYKLTGIAILTVLLTLLLTLGLSYLPFTQILINLIIYLEFSFGLTYFLKVLTEVHK